MRGVLVDEDYLLEEVLQVFGQQARFPGRLAQRFRIDRADGTRREFLSSTLYISNLWMKKPTRLPVEFTGTFRVFTFRHDMRKVFLEKRRLLRM